MYKFVWFWLVQVRFKQLTYIVLQNLIRYYVNVNLSTYRNSKECRNNERLYLLKRRGGLSAFRASGWREAKMANVHGLAQWPKFWLSREARVKRTRPFWFFLGQCQKEQWKINLKQVADFFRNLYLTLNFNDLL
jgi:hypothetical protein